MSEKEAERGSEGEDFAASRALTAPDSAAALRGAANLWAKRNTRPETLRDKVAAVTSFFDFAGKHTVCVEDLRVAVPRVCGAESTTDYISSGVRLRQTVHATS